MATGRANRASSSTGRIAAASTMCSTGKTGEFLFGKAFAKQTWAKGLGQK
jgi:hypothetical protein